MYKKDKHIHFIGIGGIGMSGIAAILKAQGFVVSGCDVVESSPVLTWLSDLGCHIHVGHDVGHIDTADVLVYSSAVNRDHPEIQMALKKSIPVIPRAIMLAELMRMKHGVAIAGSHGKTTTTSMVSYILTEAGLDPTIVIGGIVKNLSTHARLGRGDLFVAEADESDRSLLYLNPCIAIVTNIDVEHLDTYKNLSDIQETFKNFLARLPFFGKAVVCIDDKNVRALLPPVDKLGVSSSRFDWLTHIPVIKYGLSSDAQVRGEIVILEAEYSLFNVYKKSVTDDQERLLGQISLHVAGEHNVQNALGAIALGLELDLDFGVIREALKKFTGVLRRFEFKGTCNGALIFDDYGHHPTEIEKTLIVAERRTKGKLHVVFQPHRYTRTEKLWNEFLDVFGSHRIETLFLADIYAASESPIANITSQRLKEDLLIRFPNLTVYHYSKYEQIADHAHRILSPDDLFITIGAGKANCIGNMLIERDIASKKQISS